MANILKIFKEMWMWDPISPLNTFRIAGQKDAALEKKVAGSGKVSVGEQLVTEDLLLLAQESKSE